MYSNSTIIDYYADIMSNHKELSEEGEFDVELASADPKKLIVVDFNATWCGPCQKIRPFFIQLAHKYPNALFLGVDVDICRETAMEQGVSAMPTFMLYKNRERLITIRGAHEKELEDKIRLHYGQYESYPQQSRGANDPVDISPMIAHRQSECRNESELTPFHTFLHGKSVLVSGIDEQLILVYGFAQPIKLNSFKFKSRVENGPKLIKFFVNQPSILDFRSAGSTAPDQEITLQGKDLTGKYALEFDRSIRAQSVRSLQIFVVTNQNGSAKTQIDGLTLYGNPDADNLNLNREFQKLTTATASTAPGSSRKGKQ